MEPRAILMNTADYGHFWATSAPSALGISLAPNTSLARSERRIVAALGQNSGLEVLTGACTRTAL